MADKEKLFNSGVLTDHREGALLPPQDKWEAKKGGFVVIECPKRIPCNPCATSCPTGAVLPFEDINDTPKIDYDKCTGCGICVSRCPGLACFVIDLTYAPGKAVIKLPYELLPLPEKGQQVACLNRTGEEVAKGEVIAVTEPSRDKTYVVSVVIPKELADDIRAIKVPETPEFHVVCRCEEVEMETIREWIARGYDTFDELKRELRIGMGPCQGRGCRDIIMKEIAKATGKTFEEIGPGTMRPPVKPIKLSLLAKDFEDNPK
ncbi:MAG: (2Fe-2S)-binding protein [bacterium]|nr:(2Fe-2S)-binding protein [bacterium]